jgi:type III secretion protein V
MESLTALDLLAVKLSKYNDIVMAALVIAVISLIILPMPPFMVDTMICLNISITILLLMLSLYIRSTLSLSTFPTLLLFTTLFRLALNITTTRQILINADAGKIIFTFGNLVVGGNYVVGAVVFLIITIVQFVVIAKGSERVAEVSARFTLDAMPGKQMSIDADLRTETINLEEARRRREKLEDESKLFGAMDGAMKFVKGDAIAGIIITVINIIGGISVGAIQKGLTLQEATAKYTLLTIGDGLVSQVPALFISITSGIIVTRVDVRSTSKHLAGEMGRQVITQPKALLIAGVVIALFVLIPGFPKLQFAVLSSGLCLAGAGLYLFQKKASTKAREHKAITKQDETYQPGGGMIPEPSVMVPVLLALPQTNREAIDEPHLNERLRNLGKQFFKMTGVPYPGTAIRFHESLPSEHYIIYFEEIPLFQGLIPMDRLFIPAPLHLLEEKHIPHDVGPDFLPARKTVWVDAELKNQLVEHKIPFWDPLDILCEHVSFLLHKQAPDLLGVSEVRYLLNVLESRYSELVNEAVELIQLSTITEILQLLVMEAISIRNLKVILETIIEFGPKEKNVHNLLEHVRIKLKRHISHSHCDNQRVMHIILLSQDLEAELRQLLRQNLREVFFEIDFSRTQQLLKSLEGFLSAQSSYRPVIVTKSDLRAALRRLIVRKYPNIHVLSQEELSEDVSIQIVGTMAI